MRRSTMRRGGRVPLGLNTSTPRKTEADRLATITREIAEESGASCALLLGLIDRRAPGISPLEAATFILGEWRKGGNDRARLLDRALKSPAVLAAERDLAREVQTAVRHLAGHAFSVDRAKDARREVVKLLRSKCPKLPIAQLTAAAEEAIDYRDDRLVIRMDGLVALIAPAPLAS